MIPSYQVSCHCPIAVQTRYIARQINVSFSDLSMLDYCTAMASWHAQSACGYDTCTCPVREQLSHLTKKRARLSPAHSLQMLANDNNSLCE